MSFNETWEWQENEFQLDVGSPLGISPSLWDDLRVSEDESRSLFESTPARDCMESERPLISADDQGSILEDSSFHQATFEAP